MLPLRFVSPDPLPRTQINTCDSLIVTELIFENVLKDLTPAESVRFYAFAACWLCARCLPCLLHLVRPCDDAIHIYLCSAVRSLCRLLDHNAAGSNASHVAPRVFCRAQVSLLSCLIFQQKCETPPVLTDRLQKVCGMLGPFWCRRCRSCLDETSLVSMLHILAV